MADALIHPSASIHPSAIVEPGAAISPDCQIGPYSIIGPEVRLGAGVIVKSHVVIAGDTTIGEETEIYPFSSIGEAPQDRKFHGEKTKLIIGARNRIREHVTMNPGTEGGGGITRVGDDGLFLAGSHIAHDCQVGNRVTIVNHAALAGHVIVEDDVTIGGLSGVHQFVRIGRGAMIGALSMVAADVIPFGMVHGPRGQLDGLNVVGLKRRGANRDDIHALRDMLQSLTQGSFRESARSLSESDTTEMVREVLDFILGPSERGFLAPHS